MSTVALAGCPNCGKSAIFNALTGGRQKVGNYPGVTVERKIGRLGINRNIQVVDLPGIYGLRPASPDEKIAVEALTESKHLDEEPCLIAVVLDASQLERTLGLLLDLRDSGKPVVAICNMIDIARKAGLHVDTRTLERLLRVPVIATVGIDRESVSRLAERIEGLVERYPYAVGETKKIAVDVDYVIRRQKLIDEVIVKAVSGQRVAHRITELVDRFVLHRVLGPVILFSLLLFVFQAVFSWAESPMEWIETGVEWLGATVSNALPQGHWFSSLLVDGIIAGVGSVVVFLPQILILFFFILILEASGYMMRAAFIMDRLMRSIGLQGRSFVPLLSSFACAIPGMMAARTVKDDRHRLLTILITPLMTCSARLPVYVLLIGAFIPNRETFFGLNLQGLTMFGLFLLGIVSAVIVSAVLSKVAISAPQSPFVQDMPTYKLPGFRNLFMTLWLRARIFLKKAGTLILAASMVIWVLSTFPRAPENAPLPDIQYSFAGQLGSFLEPVVAPVGFDWRIATGLIPGFAAREVMVGVLGTVYAVEGAEDESGFATLQSRLASSWSLATGLALLVWYVFSPQCLATFAVMRRETGSWKWTVTSFSYLLVLAYVAAFITYRLALLMS